MDFNINFETPNLIDYLEPNKYNWVIKDEDVCYDTKRVYPCTILTYRSLEDKKEPEVQRSVLRWFLKKNYEQIHVYTNMRSGDSENDVRAGDAVGYRKFVLIEKNKAGAILKVVNTILDS